MMLPLTPCSRHWRLHKDRPRNVAAVRRGARILAANWARAYRDAGWKPSRWGAGQGAAIRASNGAGQGSGPKHEQAWCQRSGQKPAKIGAFFRVLVAATVDRNRRRTLYRSSWVRCRLGAMARPRSPSLSTRWPSIRPCSWPCLRRRVECAGVPAVWQV